MAKIKGSAWNTTGGLLITVAVTLGVGYWVATLSLPALPAWGWPIWAAGALGLVGACMVIYGMSRDKTSDNQQSHQPSPKMRQTGGANSTLYQSGRDIRMDRPDKE